MISSSQEFPKVRDSPATPNKLIPLMCFIRNHTLIYVAQCYDMQKEKKK